jgi:hypothetical protein
MSYIIGTEEYVSTWGSLRSVLFTNGVAIYPNTPPGLWITTHNKVFPPTSGEGGYTPFYFTPESGTLVKTASLLVSSSPYIYFEPSPYEPGQPINWSGYINFMGVDHRDFLYMIGKTISATATSTTIDASAETAPGQYLYTSVGQDWGYGLTGVEKFKLVT